MKILITPKAYLKMKYYIEACPIEVQGFGRVREYDIDKAEDEDNSSSRGGWLPKKEAKHCEDGKKKEHVFEIWDVEILPQEAAAASTGIDSEVMAKFLYEKIKNNQKTSDYRVWWHSHVWMGAFFSGTDTGTIESWSGMDYLISIVGNKREQYLTRFDRYEPVRYTNDSVRCVLKSSEDEKLRKACFKEIAEKVKERKYTFFNWDEKKFEDKVENLSEEDLMSMTKKQKKKFRKRMRKEGLKFKWEENKDFVSQPVGSNNYKSSPYTSHRSGYNHSRGVDIYDPNKREIKHRIDKTEYVPYRHTKIMVPKHISLPAPSRVNNLPPPPRADDDLFGDNYMDEELKQYMGH